MKKIHKLPDDTPDYVRNYVNAVNGAMAFAGDKSAVSKEAWYGLFSVGLAINNLDLINIMDMIEPEPHWTKVGIEREGQTTQTFWIAERDYFAKRL